MEVLAVQQNFLESISLEGIIASKNGYKLLAIYNKVFYTV
jgi:hypothetical protein